MIRGTWLVLLALAALVVFPACPETSEHRALLEKIQVAQESLAYSGVRVFSYLSPAADWIRLGERVQRGADGKDAIELVSVNGVTRDELVDPAQVALWETEQRTIDSVHQTIFRWRDFRVYDVDLALKHYRVTLRGGRTHLGRAVTVAEFVPHFRDRSSHCLWVDDETGLVLASMEFEPGGALVAALVFQELEVQGTRPPDSVELMTLAEAQHRASFRFLVPTWLPEGFQAYRTTLLDAPDLAADVTAPQYLLHTYSDGISWIYLIEFEPDSIPPGLATRPAAAGDKLPEVQVHVLPMKNSHLKAFVLFPEEIAVCFIGRQPDTVLRRVLESISPF